MGRYINPDSDGKFYNLSDMPKVNCHDCSGCSKCCQGMGDSVVLDPYDIYQFRKYGNISAEQLLQEQKIELGIKDRMVVPHIKMDEWLDQCPFLNREGRCSIHSYRPGICRLFPLGRNFEDGKLNYILLSELCDKTNRSKEKVSRWLGVEPASKYHDFVLLWHDFRKEMEGVFEQADEEQEKVLTMYLVRTFFLQPYDVMEDFYPQFEAKVDKYRKLFAEV